jgi:hypothetical protein
MQAASLKHAVPVHVPFLTLVLSRACSIKTAWLLSRGALTTPFRQSCILCRVREWRMTNAANARFAWDVLTLPVNLWKQGLN